MAQVRRWSYAKSHFPHCLRQTKLRLPENPNETQVIIEVHATSLNPVDVQLMNLPIWSIPLLNYEKGVGCDFSGTVIKAGAASGLSAGDEVYGLDLSPGKTGGAADALMIDTKSPEVVVEKKPTQLTHQQAAAIPLVFLTARTCIAYADGYIKAGETVCVIGGSSACGMFVCRLAKSRGWNVVASCSTKNLEFVRSCGADRVVDYSKESVTESFQAAEPKVIIDCVGGTEYISMAPRYISIVGDKMDRAALGGRSLYLVNPRMLFRWLLGYFGYGVRYDCITLETNPDYLREAGTLPPQAVVIDSVYGYEQLPEALEKLLSGRVRGKVIVEIA